MPRWRRRSEQDFDAEIQAHLELEADALIREGLTPADARDAARRAFGNVTAARERFHESRRVRWLDHLQQDLRYAMRQLRRAPGFATVVVLTLALGIALDTTMFSIVSAALLHPVPYPHPDRLASIFRTGRGSDVRGWVPAGDFVAYRRQAGSFTDLAAYSTSPFTLATAEGAEFLQGAVVTTNSFRVLGVRPVLGRDFVPEEDVPGHDLVVILSWALWQGSFGGDPGVIGRTVTLNGKLRTIVGVMPRGFEFPEMERLWVPAAFTPRDYAGRGRPWVVPFGRLAPGVDLARASAEVATIAARLDSAGPPSVGGWGARVDRFRERVIASDYVRTPLLLLLGAVGFVLLIACANVANLQLARAAARGREIALRTALGAGRWRIVRQLLTECILLALAGGALGVLLAAAAIRVVRASVPVAMPAWLEFRIDPAVLVFAALVSIVVGVVFGLAPALHAARTDPQSALQDAGRGASTGASRGWMRGALVVAEVSLSLVLVLGAALMIQSFLRLERSRVGFDPDGLVAAVASLSGPRYERTIDRVAFFSRVIDQLAATPALSGAAAVAYIPTKGGSSIRVEAEGPAAPAADAPEAVTNIVLGDYFRTMRIPMLAGRGFIEREWSDTASRVAVINEALARRFWPGESPIGRRVREAGATPGPWLTVVGVTADVAQDGPGEPSRPALFETGRPWYGMVLVARGAGSPEAATEVLRHTVEAVDRGVPVHDVSTMRDVLAHSEAVWLPRFYGMMFGTFALAALVLAAVGIYGVTAYAVRQRTREIGIRIALGAAPGQVTKLVLRDGGVLAGLGVALGIAGALVGTRLLRGLLYGISATDPATLVVVPLALAAVALAASYLPARRASRVDPAVTLRDE
ncbi:MAG TPA: ABC transporter permease [Gemmatimonadaceae bacterium]